MAAPSHGNSYENSATSTTLTIASVAGSGTDCAIFVTVQYKDNTGGLITSVVWDAATANESFTQVGSEVSQTDANASLWQIVGHTQKTATITITLSGSARVCGSASVYTGVDQTNPIRTAGVATNAGTDAAPTVNVIANADEVVIDSMAQVSAGPDTMTADHTQRHNNSASGGGTDTRGCSQTIASSGATETMGWTASSSDDWAIIAGPIQEPQAAAAAFSNPVYNSMALM